MLQDDPRPARPDEPAGPGSSDLSEALLSLDHAAAPVFAVLDGAQFENLPQQLVLGSFVSRPLYLDRGDNNPEQVVTAPHMVWLDERQVNPAGRPPAAVVPALMRLIESRPAAVFWQCPTGADTLYRHLRGINMVLYPRSALPADEPEEQPAADTELAGGMPVRDAADAAGAATADSHTAVLFRHADANVMAQVLPALEPAEAARLYGPAIRLIFAPAPDWSGGPAVFSVAAPTGTAPAAGPLRLCQASVARMDDRQLSQSRGAIASYLTAVAPEYTGLLSPAELQTLILQAERSGDRIGLQSEHAHGLWALLALITGGAILADERIVWHFENDPRDPEVVLDQLYDDMNGASDLDLGDLP